METIADKLTKKLLKNKYIEESMYEIYKYGLMMFLEIMLSFSTSVIICCAMGMIWERRILRMAHKGACCRAARRYL